MQPLPIGNMQKEELYRLIENPGLMNEETLHGLKTIVEDFPYFQTGWVLYLKNLKMVDSPEYETVLKSVAVRISNRKKLYKWLNTEVNSPVFTSFENSNSGIPSFQLTDNGESAKSNSLIDRFLSSNSVIHSRKYMEEENSPDDLQNDILEKSISENDELITETLAMIYFQQKKYDKALESFQKLSLKYPEKSAYFAAQIDKIKNINHS